VAVPVAVDVVVPAALLRQVVAVVAVPVAAAVVQARLRRQVRLPPQRLRFLLYLELTALLLPQLVAAVLQQVDVAVPVVDAAAVAQLRLAAAQLPAVAVQQLLPVRRFN
jgi:hypothetical protein